MQDPSPTLQVLDYAAVAVYMALLAGLGLFLGRLVKDIGAYFKGGGTLPWPAAAISNYMAMFSTFIFVAYAGLAYQYGLVAATIYWCTIPPTLVAAAVMAKRWRRAGIMTPVEYLETRFNAPVRQFLGWCGIAFRILDNMVRLYAMAVFVSTTTPLSLEVAILLAGAIVVIYTVSGGLWAVVLIDVVQFVILVSATLIMVPLSLRAAGGLGALADAIPDHFTFFNGPKGATLYLVAYYSMVLIKYNGNWSFIQRFYSVRDEASGRKMALLMATLFLASPLVFLLPAIAARAVVPDLANPESAYAAMALRVLPHGILGLMVAAMFAATMASVCAELNVTASVLTRDVYQRVFHPRATPREMMWAARSATVAVGAMVITGALFVGGFGGAFHANMVLTGLAIPLSVPLVLGILTRRGRPWGVFATVALGVPAGLALTYWQKELPGGMENAWALTTLIVIVVSIATMFLSDLGPTSDAAYKRRVAQFFARLATPVREEDKPQPDPVFRRALALIFAVALASTGLLFIAMSVPSLGQLSGSLALGAGTTSLVLASVIYLAVRRAKPVRQVVDEPEAAVR